MSGGNLGVAVRSIVPDILAGLGLAPPKYTVTPSWNPDLPYPISYGGIGSLSRYIIYNFLALSDDEIVSKVVEMGE
jgi:hypothetical protein